MLAGELPVSSRRFCHSFLAAVLLAMLESKPRKKGDLEGAVQMEAKREFPLLNWLLSAFNLLAGVVRLLCLPARVSCLTKTPRQVTEVREAPVLVCAGRQTAFPFFFGVMGVAEGSGAIQLAVETETAS